MSCKIEEILGNIWVRSFEHNVFSFILFILCTCMPIYLHLGYSLKYHAYELIHGIICDMCIPNLYHILLCRSIRL